MENSIASLGSHDGFDLIRKDTGEEIYWNRGTGKPAIGSKDLARLLNCDPKMVARKVVSLNLGLESEMYTQRELKLVSLLQIAPEAVAKEAISRIESSEAAADVADYAIKHKNYLDSPHAVNSASDMAMHSANSFNELTER
jgi:hypothetical protein